jgi:hypothetical protein
MGFPFSAYLFYPAKALINGIKGVHPIILKESTGKPPAKLRCIAAAGFLKHFRVQTRLGKCNTQSNNGKGAQA